MTLSPDLASSLAALARRFYAGRLVLFGSRARGDNTERSDIDLAVYGMPMALQAGAVYAGISGSYIYLFESLRERLEGFLQ